MERACFALWLIERVECAKPRRASYRQKHVNMMRISRTMDRRKPLRQTATLHAFLYAVL